MSAKSTKKASALPVPREMEEIQKTYQQMCMNAGQLQYQISVHSKELARINAQLESVNNEAAARMELDKAKPAPEAAV